MNRPAWVWALAGFVVGVYLVRGFMSYELRGCPTCEKCEQCPSLECVVDAQPECPTVVCNCATGAEVFEACAVARGCLPYVDDGCGCNP